MSDPDQELAAIAGVVPGLIQALTERLTRHGLGEIEVRRGDLRVRVVAPAGGASGVGRAPVPSHATASHGGEITYWSEASRRTG